MLKDASLLKEAALIGATWVPAGKGAIAVTNPATGETISHVPNLGAAETRAAIGGAITASDMVGKLAFTGTTEVDIEPMRQSASTVKKLTLELDGNAPFIVCDDADPDAAVEGAIISTFRNNGQTCVFANRIYVGSGVYDAFAEKLGANLATLKVGDGLDEGTVFGPLIDANAVARVEEHIAEAPVGGIKSSGLGREGARYGIEEFAAIKYLCFGGIA